MPDLPAARVRDHLVRALEADLVGPFDLDHAGSADVLTLPPSRWYLTGFLAPMESREAAAADDGDSQDPGDPTAEEQMAAGSDDDAEDAEAGAEAEPKQKNRLPASLGLSVLLPAGAESVLATVSWADYAAEAAEEEAPEESGDGREEKRRKGSGRCGAASPGRR